MGDQHCSLMEKKSLSDQKALTQDVHMRNKQNKRECLQYVYLSFLVVCFLCLGGFFLTAIVLQLGRMSLGCHQMC